MLWYHISDKFIGYNPVLEPKAYQDKEFVLWYEGNVPRICVSNNIFFCIRSMIGHEDLYTYDVLFRFRSSYDHNNLNEDKNTICGEEDGKSIIVNNPAIYATEENPYYPSNCLDFRRNNEMWFINPTQFQFIGFLSIKQFVTNYVVRLTNCQVEQFWIPKEIERIPLNPLMDCLYSDSRISRNETLFYPTNTKRDNVSLYYHDYNHPKEEEEIKNLLEKVKNLK